ncbi:hypothetical protein K8089_04490 [Aequorivita sp. F47161]|uniref:Uncharacterized protein n=1 Tax=Aequorivita vitellina TaxID=2874475 RepID=A0A9X1QRZ8_9FLAO|nr:hypothetical protein [Aequorivita vitellina]MCG2418271.1 hypothetical protein [Aequorivita vitellina]HNP69295.1 hypothetical protein [Aequorivita sp.]
MSNSFFIMTDEEVDKIINKIKSHIHDDNNGYCRVGWAMKKVLGKDIVYGDKEQVLKKVRITALITQSGEYKADPSIKEYTDWDIKPNADFIKSQLEIKLAKSNLKANKLNFKNSRLNNRATVINVIVGLLNFILLFYQLFFND